MTVEIDRIKINDESQARAMFTQGFLSNEELSKVLKDLSGKPFLANMADNANREKPKTFAGQILRCVQVKLKKS